MKGTAMSELKTYLEPLILTIILETAGAVLLGIRQKKDLFLVVLVNAVTNPLLVVTSLLLMYHMGIETGRIITYAVLEPVVIFTEYLFYRHYLEEEAAPLLLSVLLNLISITGGLLWQNIF